MTKINPKDEIVSFVADGALTSVAIACGTALYGDSSLPQAALLGFGGISALTVISRRWPWRSTTSRMPRWDRAFGVFENLTPLVGGGHTMKWNDRRESIPEEFIFYGRGLPIPISENTLFRFIKIARHRQLNSLYDTKFSMRWTGNNYRQVKLNWVFSQAHYCHRIRPRWPKDEYLGCLMILSYSRLLSGKRGQGTSGRLYGEVGEWSTEYYTRLAVEKWTARPIASSSPPSINLSRFFRNFTTR